jgi:phage shock protein A
MGIFARLSDIITANLNALLDKAEDPERMLIQVIREMEEGLAGARQQGATVIAAERRLSRELEQTRAAVEHWREQARLALASNREDLARQALARKLAHDDLSAALEQQCTSAHRAAAEVKGGLHALESRLAEARRKQRILAARHRAANIHLQVQQSRTANLPQRGDAFARFAHFEEKLADMEDNLIALAEVGRTSEVDTELQDLETQRRIDTALQELKMQVGVS